MSHLAFDRQPEYDLISSCRKSDESAWEKLIVGYQSLIYAIASNAFHLSKWDSDEIFLEVCYKITLHLNDFEARGNLASWIASITRNTCRDYIKRRGRMDYNYPINEIADNSAEEIEQQIDDIKLRFQLDKCVKELPANFRQVIALRRNGLKYKQIAQKTRVPNGTVGTHILRAVKLLSDCFKKAGYFNG